MTSAVDETVSESAHRRVRELQLRALSAVALAAVALGLTFGGLWPFALLVGATALIVAWEWGRMMRDAGIDAAYLGTAASVLAAVALVAALRPLAGLAMLATGAVVATVLAQPPGRMRAAAGVFYAGAPALALVWLRSDSGNGLAAVLLVLLVVWATDIGAFVAGRSIGGPRLWARVSPNKTWAGLGGGVLSAGLVAWLLAQTVGSAHPARVVGLGIVLAVLSQGGDLLESALKRSRGVKDASQLIPGHGGFMDRVDGLVIAAAVAALYAAALDPVAPGAALLALR
jgi:phosphatidate cytidylyltransferase